MASGGNGIAEVPINTGFASVEIPEIGHKERISELEDQLKERDRMIKELRADLVKAETIIEDQREAITEHGDILDSWIQSFEMVQNEDGKWSLSALHEHVEDYHDRYVALLRKWNAAAADFNDMYRHKRSIGRPLAATDEQCNQVRALHHKDGLSLREIAEETGLGLRTVRTIVDQNYRRDRTTKKHVERIKLDRKEERSWQARRRMRDKLPGRIDALQKKSRELAKAAKGL
jgi:hypothetical protein